MAVGIFRSSTACLYTLKCIAISEGGGGGGGAGEVMQRNIRIKIYFNQVGNILIHRKESTPATTAAEAASNVATLAVVV